MDIDLDVHVSNLQLTFVTPTLGVGVGSDLMDFADYFEHLRCRLEKERICLQEVLKKENFGSQKSVFISTLGGWGGLEGIQNFPHFF